MAEINENNSEKGFQKKDPENGYVAKRRDNGLRSAPKQKSPSKKSGKTNSSTSSNKQGGNNGAKNSGNNLKQKAATAALSTVMPVPLAEGVSKLAAKTKQKQEEKKVNDEKRRIHQSQDRLDQIRNASNKLREKKNKEESEEGEEQTNSLAQSIDDVKATAKNVKGIVKFIKMIPAPVWGIIAGLILFFLLLIIIFVGVSSISSLSLIVFGAQGEMGASENTDVINVNDNQGTGKLGYPTTSRSVSAGYPNYSDGSFHGGIDFPVTEGTSVYAAESGEVIIAKKLTTSYGYYLYIKHDNGLCTLYAHNSELLVSTGDKVIKGQQIAKSGSTGNATGPHCHFEVRTNCGVSSDNVPSGDYQDPNNYLSD